jgi:hypothetical protein
MINGFQPAPRLSPSSRYNSKEKKVIYEKVENLKSIIDQINQIKDSTDKNDKYRKWILIDERKKGFSNLMKLGLNTEEILDYLE